MEKLTFFLPLVLVLVYPLLSAHRDFAHMELDAAKNSLQGRFHALGLLLRATSLVVAGSVYAYANNWLLYGAYLFFAAAWFWFMFDLQLNLLRKKPEPFYVSRSPKAAWFDQQLVKMGRIARSTPERAAVVIKTGLVLTSFLILLWALLLL